MGADMVHHPLLPLPPARRRIPWQFSISAIIIFTTVVAVVVLLFMEDGIGILLFADGGLFVVLGMLAEMLALVGMAITLSKLPAPVAASVCVATLICLAIAIVAVSEQWFEVREEIQRLLGKSFKKQKHIDLVVFWLYFSAATIGLGSMLGYGIDLSRDRN
jgi:predicted permease